MSDFFPFRNYKIYQTSSDISSTPRLALVQKDRTVSETDKAFFEKVMAAIQLKSYEYVIVDSEDEVNVEYLLIPDPSCELDRYSFTQEGNQKRLVIHTVDQISRDKGLKSQLWSCLKEEFIN